MLLRGGSRPHRLLHSNAPTLIQFPKVRDHPLPRTARRAIGLHKGPIGVPLPVLLSVAAAHIHGPHPTELLLTCKWVGLHYTPLPRCATSTPRNPALQTKALPLAVLEKSDSKSSNFFWLRLMV